MQKERMTTKSADFPQILKVDRCKLKLQSVSLRTDGVSNLVTATAIYKLHRFTGTLFPTLVKQSGPEAMFICWNDAALRTVQITYQIIPNGGKIMYTKQAEERKGET